MAPVKQLNLSLGNPEGELEMGDSTEPNPPLCSSLLNRVLERNNLVRALKQVRRNKGAPGIDGMSVDELPDFLRQHWPKIRQQLIDGRYRPKPVKRVEIPKPDGRKRKLGILITSQLPIPHWHEAIGDPTLADAILDRLLHNAHKIQLKGESMRKKQAKDNLA